LTIRIYPNNTACVDRKYCSAADAAKLAREQEFYIRTTDESVSMKKDGVVLQVFFTPARQAKRWRSTPNKQ